MVSDFLSSPARLKIASVFIFLFAWLMQIRSKNTWTKYDKMTNGLGKGKHYRKIMFVLTNKIKGFPEV
jgi:hypothetical protein